MLQLGLNVIILFCIIVCCLVTVRDGQKSILSKPKWGAMPLVATAMLPVLEVDAV